MVRTAVAQSWPFLGDIFDTRCCHSKAGPEASVSFECDIVGCV
jgi:hypothetical protein